MSILEAIGQTPLVRLTRVVENPDVAIYAKCEYLNPSGSVKDRMALAMVEGAERSGALRPGGTILDQSTGNTGPALAFVGAVKGYRVRLVMPAQLGSTYNPGSRVKLAQQFGCSVEPLDLSDVLEATEGLPSSERGAALVAERLHHCHELDRSDPDIWWANQLGNPDNPRANRESTGPELLEQLEGQVDGWVASIGSGGTLLGVAEALLSANAELKIYGVVPTDDPRIEWVRDGIVQRRLEELGGPRLHFIIEDILDQELLDETFRIGTAEAKRMADRLASEEGLLCGLSSGANVAAAVKVGQAMPAGSRIATVLVDHRDRYIAEHPNEHYVV